jgi:hypothetical protein
MQQACPKRRKDATKAEAPPPTTWARVLTQGLQEISNADQEVVDTSTPEETQDQLQVRQPANTGMDSPSDYPQTWPVLDDQDVRNAKNANPQTRNDVTPTDTPNKVTQTYENTEETTKQPQQTGSTEQDAKDCSQLIQEDEDRSSTMMVDDSTEKSTPKKNCTHARGRESPWRR